MRIFDFIYIFEKGNMPLFDKDGNFIGLTYEDGTLLLSYFMEQDIISLLDSAKLSVSSLPALEGEYVHAPLHMIEGNKQYGLRLPRSYPEYNLLMGDIIVTINGLKLDTVHLPYRLAQSQSYLLQVLREGEIVEVSVLIEESL